MYVKNKREWLKHLDFWMLDILCLHLAFVIAYMIRYGIRNPYGTLVFLNMALAVTLIELMVTFFYKTLKGVLKRGMYLEFVKTLKHVVFVELLATFYLFSVAALHEYSRIFIYLMGVLYFIITYMIRILWKHYLKKHSINQEKRSLLILTMDDMAKSVVNHINEYNFDAFHIAGFVIINRNLSGREILGYPVVSNLRNIIDYIKSAWVDEIFICLPEGEPYSKDLVAQLTEMGIVVHIVLADDFEVMTQQQVIERIGGYTVLTSSISYATPEEFWMKRALDILGGLVGCIITGFLYVVIAPMIKKESPGPVFFSQVRIGRNGKKFKLYKFRSMYLDAEERKKELMEQNRVKDGMMFKLDWDPRIIGARKSADGREILGIGNYIRNWSLDEFPQFYNVLKGDMSLVGTRPPTVDEWEKYDAHHHVRMAIKPGITGLWQVSGRSGITDFEEVVELDRRYITEWNIGLDIKILLKTIAVVFQKDGAM